MYYKCCVDNCGSKRKDVKFHQFPSSETGLQTWLKCINSDRLRTLPIRDVRRFFVCHKHFEQRFITEKSRIRLGAYPTLFSEEEIRIGIPTVIREANPNVHVTFDHCYDRRRQHEDHTYSKPSDALLEVADPPLEQRPALREIQILQQPTVSDLPLEQRPVLREIQNLSPQPSVSGLQLEQRPVLRDIQNLPPQPSVSGALLEQRPVLQEMENLPQLPTVSEITSDTGGGRRNDGRYKVVTKRRKRVIRRVADLPPDCRILYEEYKKSKKQGDFIKRARRAVKFSKSKMFEKLTNKLNPLARKIIWMQISQSEKKIKGRRFTDEEKMIALSIFKQSPKAYRFLKKIFILPSKSTLNKMTSSLHIQPGINSQIFDAIKDQVETWSENKKFCSIIFDEVSLEPGLNYDKSIDQLNGLVHLSRRKKQFADHALAFMIRGAVHKWQQPIAFYFCEGATKTEELKVILKDIINAVIDTGLLPIALICDQGQSFQSALNGLSKETQRDRRDQSDHIVTVKGHDLNIMFDPPHLIKGIRNNFLNKNLKYGQKICQWSDIMDVYNIDCGHAETRLLHKLNDTHVIPEKINKMKVKNCTRVLSKTVAAALSYTSRFPYYPDGTKVSSTLKNTAEAVSFFDDLFDSVNGATLRSKETRGKEFKKAVTETSPHHKFWRDAIKKLENIKYIDEKRGEVSVPTLKNWVITLKSYIRVWQFFKTKNIKIMRPRYFNSDPIENFFGQVRAYNFRNNDPSCHAFISTFKSLLITRFIKFHSAGYNCEEASGAQLLNIKKLFEHKENIQPSTTLSPHVSPPMDFEQESIQVQARREHINVHSRAYTAGWLVRKINQKINCADCMTDLTTSEGSIHSWINAREYNAIKSKKLAYPAECVVRSFGTILKETNEYLESKPHSNSITKAIKGHILSKYSFDFLNCQRHKKVVLEYFLCTIIKFAVFNWCSTINKILTGTDVSRLRQNLPMMQYMALNKYKKKLKVKKK